MAVFVKTAKPRESLSATLWKGLQLQPSNWSPVPSMRSGDLEWGACMPGTERKAGRRQANEAAFMELPFWWGKTGPK